jgi:hypothetical protein
VNVIVDRIKWQGHGTLVWEIRNTHKMFVGKTEDVSIKREDNKKVDLNERDVGVRIVLICLRIWSSSLIFWTGFHKREKCSSASERLSVFPRSILIRRKLRLIQQCYSWCTKLNLSWLCIHMWSYSFSFVVPAADLFCFVNLEGSQNAIWPAYGTEYCTTYLCGSVVGRGTILHAGRSLVPFQMK